MALHVPSWGAAVATLLRPNSCTIAYLSGLSGLFVDRPPSLVLHASHWRHRLTGSRYCCCPFAALQTTFAATPPSASREPAPQTRPPAAATWAGEAQTATQSWTCVTQTPAATTASVTTRQACATATLGGPAGTATHVSWNKGAAQGCCTCGPVSLVCSS